MRQEGKGCSLQKMASSPRMLLRATATAIMLVAVTASTAVATSTVLALQPSAAMRDRMRLRGGSDCRFQVGDRVLAKTDQGWRGGTIYALQYREPEWPADKVAPYQIELDGVVEQDGQVGRPLIFAQVDSDKLVRCARDELTLEQLALHLAAARAQYLNASGVPDESVCRFMLTTRMEGLPLARARVEPSSGSAPRWDRRGSSEGLYATRAIAAGELITLYPADAMLVWGDSARSEDSDVRIIFGKHVGEADRDPARVMGEWAELIVHENMSVMADPNAIHDAAYVGHAANDGAMCASPEGQAAYERDSSAVANAELVPLDVAERDAQGQQQLVHLAVRATRDIAKGDEVLMPYGYAWWYKRIPDDADSKTPPT